MKMAARAKNGNIADKPNVTEEIASIESLISDLEARLRKLNSTVRDEAVGASGDINDFVSEALAGIMQRVRDSSETFTEDVAERAGRAGTDAFKRIAQEIEHRPLLLLAVAAGLGFALGMARK
jgi:ElaB/YqjD/DUF883 family membrane-anchored ribosome-binding protein